MRNQIKSIKNIRVVLPHAKPIQSCGILAIQFSNSGESTNTKAGYHGLSKQQIFSGPWVSQKNIEKNEFDTRIGRVAEMKIKVRILALSSSILARYRSSPVDFLRALAFLVRSTPGLVSCWCLLVLWQKCKA